jgi:hypothetical protein
MSAWLALGLGQRGQHLNEFDGEAGDLAGNNGEVQRKSFLNFISDAFGAGKDVKNPVGYFLKFGAEKETIEILSTDDEAHSRLNSLLMNLAKLHAADSLRALPSPATQYFSSIRSGLLGFEPVSLSTKLIDFVEHSLKQGLSRRR